MLAGILARLIFGPVYFVFHSIPLIISNILSTIGAVLDAVLMVATALFILGKQGRELLRSYVQQPRIRIVLIAMLAAIAISAAAPGLQYVANRVQWAHLYGQIALPQVAQYFDLSNLWHLWVALMIFGTCAEEIVFRGMLLPTLVERYGLHRGILLTGLVWSVIHFRSDVYSGLSIGEIFLHVANRILLCVGLNYFFCWLTLRQRSIIPAALAHTVWNMLTAIPDGLESPWGMEIKIALLAVRAYVVYRFWPIAALADKADAGLELSLQG